MKCKPFQEYTGQYGGGSGSKPNAFTQTCDHDLGRTGKGLVKQERR